MEDNTNTKLVETKIPIEEIINQTLIQIPKTECEFNNMLVYNAVKMVLEGLDINKNNLLLGEGGKRKRRKTIKNNKRKYKNKLTKYKRKMIQKGGTNPQLIILLISLLLVLVKGITNTTDIEIIKRIKQSAESYDIFTNYYGTCSLNTMLFLKTIDLPTFEELSVNIMTNKIKFSTAKMLPYLNKELDVKGEWTEVNLEENENEQNYINSLKNIMISMRLKYGYKQNASLITAMTYQVKNKETSHAVILWLTSSNKLVLIDPQLFSKYGVIIYGSELESGKKYLDSEKKIKVYSLSYYIKKNINFDKKSDNYLFPTRVLSSIHLEINDIYGKNELSLNNKLLTDTITRIKNLDTELGTEKNKFREQL